MCEILKYLFDGKNKTRVCAAITFLSIGALAAIVWWLAFRRQQFLPTIFANREALIWSLGWTAIGIGTGLINDRNNPSNRAKNRLHYWTYFPLVLFFGTIAGITVFLKVHGPGTYPISLLASFAIGFSGDSLAGVIVNNAKIEN